VHLPEIDTYTKVRTDSILSRFELHAGLISPSIQLKPHVMVLLVEALNNEVYPTNVRLLLPLCYTYSCEDIFYSADFTKLAITTIG